MAFDVGEEFPGTIPKIVGEANQESFTREAGEPSFQLVDIPTSGEIRPVLVRSRHRGWIAIETGLLAVESPGFGRDRVIEVQPLEAMSNGMAVM